MNRIARRKHETIINNPHFIVMQDDVETLIIAEDETYIFSPDIHGKIKLNKLSTSVLQMILTGFGHLRDDLEFDVYPIEVMYHSGFDGDTIKTFRFNVDEYTCEGEILEDKSGFLDISLGSRHIYSISEDTDTEICDNLNMSIISFFLEVHKERFRDERN